MQARTFADGRRWIRWLCDQEVVPRFATVLSGDAQCGACTARDPRWADLSPLGEPPPADLVYRCNRCRRLTCLARWP